MPPADRSASFAGLPDILREIAEVAGLEAAIKLGRARGGTEISIPRHAGPDHWLVRCVGSEAARTLCRHFAVRDADGRAIAFTAYLPLANDGLMARTIADLARALETEKLSTLDAVRRFGVSDRTVKRIRARLKAQDQHRLL